MSIQEVLREILLGNQFTEAEKAVVKWQFGLNGGFYRALWGAIITADDKNLVKLAFSFPEEVTGFLAWSRGDLAKRLRAAGLLI